jgi:RHS repeat-associated protein
LLIARPACRSQVNSYDNANRLTQISQSSSTTSFTYDNNNRRTSLTLPNGVVVSYSYDNDSRLTGITYQFGSSTLGNLSYTYDQLSRRTQVGGSFARTGLPGAVSSGTYDGANQLTHWNGIGLSYDANGNMLTDGSNAFTWNARNQVASLNNVSLKYDMAGRRVQNASGTSFLYDGANAVQELSGTTVTANLLNGGIDEVFTRTDSSGAFTQLKDAVGSTIALADSSGNVDTLYTYDPFGNTSVSGSSNSNVYQYTGRENEGNGLYFYRARDYSPLLGRFISEDPLGFAGSGTNFYAFVEDNPTDGNDPSGLSSTDAHNQMIWNALHPCGVSNADIWQIQRGSHLVDGIFKIPSGPSCTR